MLIDTGISFCVMHSLRYSFASFLADQGFPLHIVQALLRHIDISTTQIYLHSDFSKMYEEIMKLESIFTENALHLKKERRIFEQRGKTLSHIHTHSARIQLREKYRKW